MKYIIKTSLLLTMIFVMVTGCEDLTDINEDPNRPAEVSVDYLLTAAQRQLGLRYYGVFDNIAFGMTIAQYWAQNEYSDEVRYQYRPATNNTFWLQFYTAINDLEEIIRINDELDLEDPTVNAAQVNNQNAIATIMKAWAYHNMVDIYGNIPYSEALRGSEIPNPAYDDQEEIYNSLITNVQNAVADIDEDEPGFAGGDVVYGGDMSKWAKFGNSLLLRMGIRISDVNSTLAQDVISGAADNAISSNADNAAFQFITEQPSVNPLYVSYIVDGRQDYAATANFINLLNSLNDPRVAEYFSPADESGEFVGLTYGLESAEAAAIPRSEVSQLNPQLLEPDFEGMMMDYAETSFILAEAASKGWVSGSPEQFYNQGIAASMEYWEAASSAQISNYIASNPYSEDNLAIQKYIAFYMQGWQAWAEIRRLDLENIPEANLVVYEPSENFIDIQGIPKRRIYPLDEQSLNSSNYAEAANDIGGDEYDTNLFWDVD
ncbi:SusD/RagB family nutrient-binding outer membrane lipoprotein [Marivirga sp. S37H4]|uniref:SusD/RagB family nutrient-binding outer membrane lipoprotein n=1 Tax=Marivirga aurantiaca TaxID=2802615 RepID=A0A934WUV9_9BACT|nr:SusD/RagB family nutrient-binding outer membrane lipoprotein [Marivirga aurantiaca]MBK6263459.1 SusD/RagB family nutrient-binding outer membrane lipoprotein [Marivirga aurantiaca]